MCGKMSIVRTTERLWVRLSVTVVTVFGLLGGMVFFPPESMGARVCVLAMVALLLVGLGFLAAFRHKGVARAAREHSDKSGDVVVVLFERAALYAPRPREDVRPIVKGWLSLGGSDMTVWEVGNRPPFAVFARTAVSVVPSQGSPFARPLARFHFADGSELGAVVVRHGFADLRGWSAANIRALNFQLNPASR